MLGRRMEPIFQKNRTYLFLGLCEIRVNLLQPTSMYFCIVGKYSIHMEPLGLIFIHASFLCLITERSESAFPLADPWLIPIPLGK